MSALTSRLLVLSSIVGLVAAAGCDRAPARGPSAVTTTSGNMRPDARTASPRTTDNAGFVDNGGRSSSERGRTEMSGMRATEAGTETPTGTTGAGFPLSGRTYATEPSGGKAADPAVTPSGTPGEAVHGRIAQAMCDYAMSCERVGKQKRHPSVAACVDRGRVTTKEDLATAGCTTGYDTSALASCLSAIRSASCERHVDRVFALKECEPRMLCASRP